MISIRFILFLKKGIQEVFYSSRVAVADLIGEYNFAGVHMLHYVCLHAIGSVWRGYGCMHKKCIAMSIRKTRYRRAGSLSTDEFDCLGLN